MEWDWDPYWLYSYWKSHLVVAGLTIVLVLVSRWGEYSRDQAAHCADCTREEETCPTMRHGASRGHHVFLPVDTCKNVGEMRHQRAMQTMRRLANRGARSAGYWNLFHTSPLAPRTPNMRLQRWLDSRILLRAPGTPAGRCRADSLGLITR